MDIQICINEPQLYIDCYVFNLNVLGQMSDPHCMWRGTLILRVLCPLGDPMKERLILVYFVRTYRKLSTVNIFHGMADIQ